MSKIIWNPLILLCDVAEPWQLGMQDPASPSAEGVIELHDTIIFYIVAILIFVFWILGTIIINYNATGSGTWISHKYQNHGTLLELVWTITPAFVLVAIAFPSFKLLYLLDEVISPSLTIKVVGHQWYWSYEYSDYITENGEAIEFDSYMVPDADLEVGQFRVLEVDNPVVIPENTHVRFIVTGADVIHSFAIPSLGVKVDGIVGRLNATSTIAERPGSFYGQCSELCGPYHYAIPILVKVVSIDNYITWLDSILDA